ncbi:Asparagine synthetase domain-containing protein CG17486-like Protein [Tribolium castaneum]|uniref:Asparagine synthetase domain-containing protein CG17486-like Protein n=1 Tax=Tribolium castaneum TaxID=7070 RepID=D6WQE0_TRICA|nr:Asparagine synthetase domain-containing protein CG17486-like Protein [Tribolium castaneum]
MCGIFCLLSFDKSNTETLHYKFELFKEQISRRGPNSLKTDFCQLNNCNILFASSVLWLQGTDITTQPCKNDNSVFIYNGDIFGGSQIGQQLNSGSGDTNLFFDALQNSDDILMTLDNIEGPYAFVYLNVVQNKVYIGRDIFGRRSLLIGRNANEFVITSVAKRGTEFEFMELPSIGIFSIDLDTKQWKILPWRRKNKNFVEKLSEFELFINQTVLKQADVFDRKKTFVPPSEAQLKLLTGFLDLQTCDLFNFLFNSPFMNNILRLKELLQNSIKKRILAQPKFCQNCYKKYDCDHAITGILFSGGVDCAVLALLASTVIDPLRPIDLMNVAFEKGGCYDTPDRITGLSTLRELQQLCPDRKWNFVEVNVTREELDKCRRDRISDLIFPLNSILDDSLGCALWFASRGVTQDYTTPCRVKTEVFHLSHQIQTLLVGMGADELFGGYTRHRAAFQKKGWEGLSEILDEDWQNLPYRNLARDDRVVSDHGRQLRTPYLDEEVVKFVHSLHTWDKTFPSIKLQGIGEKLLLRSLAYHLGLTKAALLKKRALQFGSRIANSKEKGHEISQHLTAT